MKTRIIVVLGVALVAGGISVRADTPEQAAARAALEQKMDELDHAPTSPPADTNSVTTMAKPAEAASSATDLASAATTTPVTAPAETIPAVAPTAEDPATVTPAKATPVATAPADADFPETIPAADASAQAAALAALQQKMSELDQPAARPSPDTNSMATAAKSPESITTTSTVPANAVTSPAAPVTEAAAAVNASVQAVALAAVQQKIQELNKPEAQPVTETPAAQAPVAVSPVIAPTTAATPSASPAVVAPAPEVSTAPAAAPEVAVVPAAPAEPVAVPAETQPAVAPAVSAPMILPYSSPGHARPVNQLVTMSGAIYKDVEVEGVKDDGIVISYTTANGSWAMAKVHFEDLPAEIRQQYGK
jgi:hypothetical protein